MFISGANYGNEGIQSGSRPICLHASDPAAVPIPLYILTMQPTDKYALDLNVIFSHHVHEFLHGYWI